MGQRKFGQCVLALSLAVAGVALADLKTDAQLGSVTVLKDDLASAGTVRASKLIGTEIYDPAGKDVGKIKDIVLDRDRGTIEYTVLSHGTPGIDEKFIALPYKALGFGGPLDDRAYVQVDKHVIDNAPGFDQANWPTEVSATYYRSLDAYYNTRLSSTVRPPAAAGEAQPAAATVAPPATLSWDRRAGKLIGSEVLSPTGERLGSIKDLVLDTSTGDVRYAVLSHGGPLAKSRYYAVPLNQFRINGNGKKLVLDISLADLKANPSFDTDHWPASADPRWTAAKGEMMK